MSFPSVSVTYDAANVDEVLADLKQELEDERQLETKLNEMSSEAKLAEAEEFISRNADSVSRQHAEILEIDSELKALIEKNKRLVAADKAYHALVGAEDYKKVASQIAEIRAVSKSLHNLLVKEGIRGRVPAPESGSNATTD